MELPEAKVKKGSAPETSRALEADALLGLKGPQDWLIALDERGRELESPALAKFIEKAQLSSKDLLFVLGGDEGLDPRVRDSAHLVLSLSKMVLPHRLARLVLIEQLYRAHTILRGEPYHK